MALWGLILPNGGSTGGGHVYVVPRAVPFKKKLPPYILDKLFLSKMLTARHMSMLTLTLVLRFALYHFLYIVGTDSGVWSQLMPLNN